MADEPRRMSIDQRFTNLIDSRDHDEYLPDHLATIVAQFKNMTHAEVAFISGAAQSAMFDKQREPFNLKSIPPGTKGILVGLTGSENGQLTEVVEHIKTKIAVRTPFSPTGRIRIPGNCILPLPKYKKDIP